MLIVVGGHSRNIGKTSVVAGLIRAIPEANWTAVKITQYGHGICSSASEACACADGSEAHPYALDLEREPDPRTDSGRFLAAGAVRSYWLRTKVGFLGNAIGPLREIIEASENVILESNSVLRFVLPDLYLVVLDFTVADMKESTRLYMDRADAFIVVDRDERKPPWAGIPARWFARKPRFVVAPPAYITDDVVGFVRAKV